MHRSIEICSTLMLTEVDTFIRSAKIRFFVSEAKWRWLVRSMISLYASQLGPPQEPRDGSAYYHKAILKPELASSTRGIAGRNEEESGRVPVVQAECAVSCTSMRPA